MFIANQFIPGKCTKNLYLEFDVNFNSYLRINQKNYHNKSKSYKGSVEGKIDSEDRRLLLINNKSKYTILDKIRKDVCKVEISKYNNNVFIEIVNGIKKNSIEISKDEYNQILKVMNFNYDKIEETKQLT